MSPSHGQIDTDAHRLPVRVYYADTDASGVVYHARYLEWFERGRTEYLRALGITHGSGDIARTGYFAVAAMAIEWHRPALLDDPLVVDSIVTAVRAAAVVLRQRIVHESASLCTASVTVAWLAPDGRPQRLPPAWRQPLAAITQKTGPD